MSRHRSHLPQDAPDARKPRLYRQWGGDEAVTNEAAKWFIGVYRCHSVGGSFGGKLLIVL
jgi:hypothetical protein